MVPTKFELEHLCIGSDTNENLSVLTGFNEVQTVGLLEILICFSGGAREMASQKEFFKHCTGSGTNENFLVLTSTNEVPTISVFEILFAGGGWRGQ